MKKSTLIKTAILGGFIICNRPAFAQNTAADVLKTLEQTRLHLTTGDTKAIAAQMTSDAQIREGYGKPMSREKWLEHELEEASSGAVLTQRKTLFDVVKIHTRTARDRKLSVEVTSRIYFSSNIAPKAGAKTSKLQMSGIIHATLVPKDGIWMWQKLQMIPIKTLIDGKSRQ